MRLKPSLVLATLRSRPHALLLFRSFPLLGNLGLAGLRLLLQDLRLRLFRLGLVNCLYKHTLVLELVTLGFVVEVMVQVLVDLLPLAVLAQQPAQHALPAHPEHLLGHPRLFGPAALPHTSVPALALGSKV